MPGKIISLLLIFFTFCAHAYDKPNSITFYPATKCYFISNLAGKSITRLDTNLDKTDVITGLTRPKDILFAAFGPYNGLLILDSNQVKVYDADSYTFIAGFKVSGAMDLEDAEADKTTPGTFYISDPLAHKIFKVVVGPAPFYIPSFTVLNSTVRNPKALLFDSQDRLLVTTDTAKSAVYYINTATGNASLITTTTIDNINSIEEDLQGNFYATSWADSYFYRLDKNFKNATDLALYSKPTGLYFNVIYDVIALACSNCNKVEFHKLHMVYINDVDTAGCPGDSFNVNNSLQFKGKGTYNTGNTFFVELSDGSGKFSGAIIIGMKKANTEPSYFKVGLPKGKRFYGSNYKIRVRSTNPVFYSLNEMETVVPYIPTINISNKDTHFFCSPSLITFGTKKDVDSAFVNYLWYQNGIKISNALPTYQNTFTVKTDLKLIKSPLNSKCLLKDSVVLLPSTTIQIPFKDTIKACENSWVSVGGDSIPNTKIEWTSKKYPAIRNEFNPKYQLNFNDTFLVKVSSITGSCSSQKTIYAYALPHPDYHSNDTNWFNCNYSNAGLLVSYINGIQNNIKFRWQPGKYIQDSTSQQGRFYSVKGGNYKYKFLAIDTVYNCYDSILFSITNIETPVEPVLGKNNTGVVIKNFDPRFNYRWYKDGIIVTQTKNDSQFVVPVGGTKWGTYKVIAINSDSFYCADTSDLFTLDDPGAINRIRNTVLSIYPNPANDKIFIKYFNLNLQRWEVNIHDMVGQKVLMLNPASNGEININGLMPGIYSVRVNFEGRIFSATFIKQ